MKVLIITDVERHLKHVYRTYFGILAFFEIFLTNRKYTSSQWKKNGFILVHKSRFNKIEKIVLYRPYSLTSDELS